MSGDGGGFISSLWMCEVSLAWRAVIFKSTLVSQSVSRSVDWFSYRMGPDFSFLILPKNLGSGRMIKWKEERLRCVNKYEHLSAGRLTQCLLSK